MPLALQQQELPALVLKLVAEAQMTPVLQWKLRGDSWNQACALLPLEQREQRPLAHIHCFELLLAVCALAWSRGGGHSGTHPVWLLPVVSPTAYTVCCEPLSLLSWHLAVFSAPGVALADPHTERPPGSLFGKRRPSPPESAS